jgi:hypothetical protein
MAKGSSAKGPISTKLQSYGSLSQQSDEKGRDHDSAADQGAGGERCAPVLVKVRHGLMTANLRLPTSIP